MVTWNYGIIERNGVFDVVEIYLDPDDGHFHIYWTDEPVTLGGFESVEELRESVFDIAEDIENRRLHITPHTTTVAIEDGVTGESE